MAKLSHCGRWVRAQEHRIMSDRPAYKYQRVYVARQCPVCKKRLWYWCGEYADGTLTELYPIADEQQAAWKKRFTPDKPRPKIQMTSDYSQRIKGGCPIKLLAYLRKLDRARHYKPLPLDR